MPLTALVIGAGIAGPVTAAALQRAGLDPVVYEAYDGNAEGVGAFLGLAVNGISALHTLGLDEPVLARGFATPRMIIHNGRGRVLADFTQGGTLSDGTSGVTLSRADLCAALVDQAADRGIPIVRGKRLAAIEDTRSGVRAHFTDGTTAEGDILVGADGIRSVTRGLIDIAAPRPRYVGFLNTAGYARGLNLGIEPGVNHLVFGKRCFFGYVVHPDGSIWWFANPPRRSEPDPVELAAVPADVWRAQLRDLFLGDDVPALAAIDHTERISTGWVTYDMPSVPTWHRGGVALVGDAAHAVSPSAGQGASLAIEDAVVLGKCLRDFPEPAAAFRAYETARRPRVERIVKQGRRNGSGKTAGPVARVLRDATMPLAMKAMFGNGRDPLRWIWDHRVDWDAKAST